MIFIETKSFAYGELRVNLVAALWPQKPGITAGSELNLEIAFTCEIALAFAA
jgi:hypothetical protein